MEDWYCKHGYREGRDCPDCDVPSHWPAVLISEEEGQEIDAQTRDLNATYHECDEDTR